MKASSILCDGRAKVKYNGCLSISKIEITHLYKITAIFSLLTKDLNINAITTIETKSVIFHL